MERPVHFRLSTMMKSAPTSTLHVHTAVLFHESSDLTESLLPKQETPSPALSLPLYFVFGATLGIVFSGVGFYVHQVLVKESLFLFAISWSIFTSSSAYLLFHATAHLSGEVDEPDLSDDDWQAAEYYYALGVFLGFCLTCTAVDIVIGMPLVSIGLTLVVAVVWSGVMMKCAGYRGRRRRPTVLPLIVV